MKKPAGDILFVSVCALLTAGAIALAATRGMASFVGAEDWLNFTAGRLGNVWYPLAGFAVFAFVVYAVLCGAEDARAGTMAAGVVAVALAGFALHTSTAYVARGGLKESVLALVPPKTNPYYLAGARAGDLNAYLVRYEAAVARSNSTQLRTHPPGPVIAYHLLAELYRSSPRLRAAVVRLADLLDPSAERLESPAVYALFGSLGVDQAGIDAARCVALSIQFLACLVVVPVYLLGAALHSRQTGLAAAAFALLVPAFNLFSPGLDQVYPLFAASLAWLAQAALSRRSMAAGFLFGLLLGAAMLFSLAFAVVLALIVSVAAVSFLRNLALGAGHPAGREESGAAAAGFERARPSRAGLIRWRVFAAAAIGLAALIALFAFAWRIDLFAVWARCLRENELFNLEHPRPYAWSLWSDPAEFLIFLGLPLSAAFLMSVGRAAGSLRRAWLPAAAILCFAAVMLALNLSGVNRGEVARLWLFAAPFAAAAAAWRLNERRSPAWVLLALLALQFAQVVFFRFRLDVFQLYT